MMQFLGLTAEDYAAENTVEVFPDNVPAVNLFIALRRQWRVGPGGPYALDYNVLFHKMDRMGLSPDEYEAMEDAIRTLEDSALEEMHKEDD